MALPSLLASHLAWPRLHLARARLLLTGGGARGLARARVEEDHHKEEVRARGIKRRLALVVGRRKVLGGQGQGQDGLHSILVAPGPGHQEGPGGHHHLSQVLLHLALGPRSTGVARVVRGLMKLVRAIPGDLATADNFIDALCSTCTVDSGRALLVHVRGLVYGVVGRLVEGGGVAMEEVLERVVTWGGRLQEVYGGGRLRLVHSSLLILHQQIALRRPHQRTLLCKVQGLLQEQGLHLGHLPGPGVQSQPTPHERALHHLLAGQLDRAMLEWSQEVFSCPALLAPRAPQMLVALLSHHRVLEAMALLTWVSCRAPVEVTRAVAHQLARALTTHLTGRSMALDHPAQGLAPTHLQGGQVTRALEVQGLREVLGPATILRLLLTWDLGEEAVRLAEELGDPVLATVLAHCIGAAEVWGPLLSSLCMEQVEEQGLRQLLVTALLARASLLPLLLARAVVHLEQGLDQLVLAPNPGPPAPGLLEAGPGQGPRAPLYSTVAWVVALLKAGGDGQGPEAAALLQRFYRVVVEFQLVTKVEHMVARVYLHQGRTKSRAREVVEAAIEALGLCRGEVKKRVVELVQGILVEVSGEQGSKSLEEVMEGGGVGDITSLHMYRKVEALVQGRQVAPLQVPVLPSNRAALLDQAFPAQSVKDQRKPAPAKVHPWTREERQPTKKGLFRQRKEGQGNIKSSNILSSKETDLVLMQPLWKELVEGDRREVEVKGEEERLVGALYCWYTQNQCLSIKNRRRVGLGLTLADLVNVRKRTLLSQPSLLENSQKHWTVPACKIGIESAKKGILLSSGNEVEECIQYTEDEPNRQDQEKKEYHEEDTDESIDENSTIFSTFTEATEASSVTWPVSAERTVHPNSPVHGATIGDLSTLEVPGPSLDARSGGWEGCGELEEEANMSIDVSPPLLHSEYLEAPTIPPLYLDDLASMASIDPSIPDSSGRSLGTDSKLLSNMSANDVTNIETDIPSTSPTHSSTSNPEKTYGFSRTLLTFEKNQKLVEKPKFHELELQSRNKKLIADKTELATSIANVEKLPEKKPCPSVKKSPNLQLLTFKTPHLKEPTILKMTEPMTQKLENPSELKLLRFEPSKTNELIQTKQSMTLQTMPARDEHNQNLPQPRPKEVGREAIKKKLEIENLEKQLGLFESKLLKQSQKPVINLTNKEPCLNLGLHHGKEGMNRPRTWPTDYKNCIDDAPRPPLKRLFRSKHVIEIDDFMEEFGDDYSISNTPETLETTKVLQVCSSNKTGSKGSVKENLSESILTAKEATFSVTNSLDTVQFSGGVGGSGSCLQLTLKEASPSVSSPDTEGSLKPPDSPVPTQPTQPVKPPSLKPIVCGIETNLMSDSETNISEADAPECCAVDSIHTSIPTRPHELEEEVLEDSLKSLPTDSVNATKQNYQQSETIEIDMTLDLIEDKEELTSSKSPSKENMNPSLSSSDQSQADDTYKTEVEDEDFEMSESSETTDSLVGLVMATSTTLQDRLLAVEMLSTAVMEDFNDSTRLLSTIQKVSEFEEEGERMWERERREGRVTGGEGEEFRCGGKEEEGVRCGGMLLEQYRESRELGVILEVASQEGSSSH